MKKIFLVLCFLVGLLSLSSCDVSTNISYVDENGETQTLKVTATDDQEVVKKVVDYAINANYEDLNNYTFNVDANFNAIFNKEFIASVPNQKIGDLNGSFKLDLNADLSNGLDASLDFNMSLGESNNMRLNAGCIYNGLLNEINDESYLYVKGLYYEKSISNEETKTIKNAYKFKPIINDFIPEDNNETTSIKDLIDLNELIRKVNPEFIVSKVTSGTIYLEATISLKDLLNNLDEVNSEEIIYFTYLLGSADIKLTFSYGLEAKTGRFKTFSFSYVDEALINNLIANSLHLSNVNVLDKIEMNLEVLLETNNAKIKKLSDEEKAKYSISNDILM